MKLQSRRLGARHCPGSKKGFGSGFTLIELLVVLVIIGVLASAVTVNLNIRNTGKSVRNEALRIGLLMQLASDTAIYSRQQLGIRFHPESYEFYILAPTEEGGEAEWQPTEDERLSMREPEVPIEFEVEIESLAIVLETLEEEIESQTGAEPEPIKPHVLLLSNGEIMPDFRVVVTDSEDQEYKHQVYSGEEEPIIVEPFE